MAESSQASKPPKAWPIISIILSIPILIFLVLTILGKFVNLDYANSVFTILALPINLVTNLLTGLAVIISPELTFITIFVILIMNPVCALGYLIENRHEHLPFAIKNLILATLPLLFSILIINYLRVL